MKLRELLKAMRQDELMVVRQCAERGGVENRMSHPTYWLINDPNVCDMDVKDITCYDGKVMVSVGENWR